ncbi:hypothetical protein C8N31_11531 [Sulfitobacter mediterraneus]|uniref:Tat pathway signal sequence domain protein n=2 Tax=Sulfitobacter mediterraneus TaxID=83219 RepID=A0A2T6C8X7_9RHOB|nr:hypothetical protein C8N31_11531 [Sulfitobacter mediterraneus]
MRSLFWGKDVKRFSTIAAAAIFGIMATGATADSGDLTVELNKFEPGETGGCQAFFLFRNEVGKSFEGFEMSLAILDSQGVIDRLLSIDAAPLPIERTTLKLFAIPEIACTDISEILLHDITTCKPQNEAQLDCFSFLKLTSKTTTKLVK